MAKILRWEPMMLLGRPVPDAQEAVLDDDRGVRVHCHQNVYGAFVANILILQAETETDVLISWPHAEPDHRIPEDSVKEWASIVLPTMVELFGPEAED
jgi:hypothetical protein